MDEHLRCEFCGSEPEAHGDSDAGPMTLCPTGGGAVTKTTLPHVLTPETARILRRVGSNAREAVAKRDDAIRAAVAEGASYREVGEAVGLSHTAVAFIARGRRAQQEAEGSRE